MSAHYELYFSREWDTADLFYKGQLIAEKDYKWDVPRQARLSGVSVVNYILPGAYDLSDVRLILDVAAEIVIFYDGIGNLRISQWTGTCGTFEIEWYEDVDSYILVQLGQNVTKYDLARMLDGFTYTSAFHFDRGESVNTSFKDKWDVCVAMAEFMLKGDN